MHLRQLLWTLEILCKTSSSSVSRHWSRVPVQYNPPATSIQWADGKPHWRCCEVVVVISLSSLNDSINSVNSLPSSSSSLAGVVVISSKETRRWWSTLDIQLNIMLDGSRSLVIPAHQYYYNLRQELIREETRDGSSTGRFWQEITVGFCSSTVTL